MLPSVDRRRLRCSQCVRRCWCGPSRLRQLSRGFLEVAPGLIAVLVFPILVEAGFGQRLAEGLAIDLVKLDPLCRQILTKRLAEPGDVGTLIGRGAVQLAG